MGQIHFYQLIEQHEKYNKAFCSNMNMNTLTICCNELFFLTVEILGLGLLVYDDCMIVLRWI